MKQSKKELFFEILRFLIVGGLATLVDYAIFYLFNLLILKAIPEQANITISTCLGFVAGMFTNWFLQKFVYKAVTDNQMHDKKVFIKFVILSLVGLGITELGMLAATPLYPRLVLKLFGKWEFQFWKLFFKVLMTCIVLVINYLGRKFIVFKDTSKKENTDVSLEEKNPSLENEETSEK